ncbi:MAG: alpha/beta hydrolase [Leptospira sp.]|nr:alpha/beta hydrolase [Leptospira sp.]
MLKMKSSRVVAGIIVFLLILFSVVPWYFSSLVFYPPVNCTKDHHVYCTNPSELNLKFDEIDLTTSDNVKLNGWYIPAVNSTKGIVLVHGHGGAKTEGLRFSPALHKAGYNLLLIDLRRNHGKFASMGFFERRDVKAATDFLINEKKLKSVGIFGFSMGAATSILAMEEDPRIKAGLFSSGYASAMDVLSEAAKRDYKVPYYPLIPIVRAFLNFRGNMTIESVRPVDKIGNISPRPIGIFHCDKDDYVDSSHAEKLFANAKEPKEKWIPVCNKHERIWNFHREEADKRTVQFFTKNL